MDQKTAVAVLRSCDPCEGGRLQQNAHLRGPSTVLNPSQQEQMGEGQNQRLGEGNYALWWKSNTTKILSHWMGHTWTHGVVRTLIRSAAHVDLDTIINWHKPPILIRTKSY